MDKLTQTTEKLYVALDEVPARNLRELAEMKYMKALCTHIHNLVLIHNVGIADTMKIHVKGSCIAESFDLRQSIIDKFIQLTNTNKEKLDRLIKESGQEYLKPFESITKEYIELLGIHNYVSRSCIIKNGIYKITVRDKDSQTSYIKVSKTLYDIISQIDALNHSFSKYITDRIVEEEYENLNK